jgi:hypothetical protein
MSDITISANQSSDKTTLSFTVTGQSGSAGTGNVTIPKNLVTYGTTPTIYIDNQLCKNQGYTEDSANYYVWYTTHFSTHEVSIVFLGGASQEFPSLLIIAPIVTTAGAMIAVLAFRAHKKNRSKISN